MAECAQVAEAVKIRDRLMPPKAAADIVVSDDDMECLKVVLAWHKGITDDVSTAANAATQALERRGGRAILS